MPIDRVPFYTNEQFATEDLTALERAVESAIEDVVGFGLYRPTLQVPFGDAPAAALLGGLGASPSGASLLIAPGALISTVASPDNPSRSERYLSFLPAAVTVPLPTPVVDTWYIVTGRPELVADAPVQRRVWDEANVRWQNPSPSLVKRRRANMVLEVQASPISGQLGLVLPAGTVPLWAVLRPAGGGAVVPVDLRPQQARAGRSSGDNTGAHYRQNAWLYTPATGLRLNCHVELDAHELHAHGSSLDPIAYKDPTSSAPADGEWWYLYLAPFKALGPLVAPRNAQAGNTNLAQQGLLVFSKTPPYARDSNYQRRNSGALTAPEPFNGATIASADAVLIATLKRVSGAWLSAQGDGDWTQLPTEPSQQGAAATAEWTFVPDAPIGARALSYEVGLGADASDTPTTILLHHGATVFYRAFPTYDPSGTQSARDNTGEFGIAALPSGVPITVTGSAPKTWTLRLKGYRI